MDDRHPYAIYNEAVQASLEKHGTIPHCDSLILHPFGTCVYCDERPELHEVRQKLRIAHTGEPSADKLPCPATARRSQELIEQWHGNVPMTQEKIDEEDRQLEEYRKQVERLWNMGTTQ